MPGETSILLFESISLISTFQSRRAHNLSYLKGIPRQLYISRFPLSFSIIHILQNKSNINHPELFSNFVITLEYVCVILSNSSVLISFCLQSN